MTVSIGPVAVVEPPGAGPAVDQDVHATQLLRRIGDHAVHLFLAGDIGCERHDAPVCLGSQLPRRRLQIRLVPRYDRHIGPFASEFPRDGFANAPTTASHDRMLVLQSEVHGIISLVRVTAILLLHCLWFFLRDPGARVFARRRTVYGTCLHAFRQRAAAA